MKRILYFPLIIGSVLLATTSCKNEEDDIFDASAAERLNAASEIYSARLTAQPNGWAMQYYPTYDNSAPNGKGYLLLTRFNPDGTVTVSGYDWPYWSYDRTGDLSNSTSEWVAHYLNEYREDTSYWEVITDNGPVLTFNSYNSNLHYFSDPDYRETGTGFGGDYEFIVVDAPEDASYMMLKGKKRSTYNLLTPIEEGVVYADYMADVKGFHNEIFPVNELVSNLVHFGDTIYRMDDSNDGLPNIYPYDGDPIANENFNPFLVTKRGEDYYIRFRDAFIRDDMEGTLQELRYDKTLDEFIGTDNSDFRITGYPAGRFFGEYLENGHSWQMTLASEKSTSFQTALDALKAELLASPSAYEIDGFNDASKVIKLTQLGNEILMGITVKFKRQRNTYTVELSYAYKLTAEDSRVTLEYIDTRTDAAKTFYNSFESVRHFVEMLAGSYHIAGQTSNFHLESLTLQSESNAEDWLILNNAM